MIKVLLITRPVFKKVLQKDIKEINLFKVLSLTLETSLKLTGFMLIFGGLITYLYLKEIGFSYLFPTLAFDSHLILITLSLGLLISMMALCFSMQPFLLHQLKSVTQTLGIPDLLSVEIFSRKIPLIIIPLVGTPFLLYLCSVHNYHIGWFILSSILLVMLTVIICFLFNHSYNGYIKQQKLKSSLGISILIFLIWSCCILPIITALFLNIFKKEISDSNIDTNYIFIIWIILNSIYSLILAIQIKTDRYTELLKVFFITLIVIGLFFVSTSSPFINAAMHFFSIKEHPQEAKWYLLKDINEYYKLNPEGLQIAVHNSDKKSFYIHAYSIFNYPGKRILCNPNSTQKEFKYSCVVMNDDEARVVTTSKECSQNIEACKFNLKK